MINAITDSALLDPAYARWQKGTFDRPTKSYDYIPRVPFNEEYIKEYWKEKQAKADEKSLDVMGMLPGDAPSKATSTIEVKKPRVILIKKAK